jgi:hypothetical protein
MAERLHPDCLAINATLRVIEDDHDLRTSRKQLL